MMRQFEPALAPTHEARPSIPATNVVTPVVVVQFPDVWGRNISPFGLKLEAWLRLADIPYTVQPSTDFGRAPKNKLPYVLDEGRRIGDTSLIIQHLKATRLIDPDAGLGPRELAEGLALQRLFEEHLYFAIVYSRWIDEAGWGPLRDAVFGRLAFPLRQVAAGRYRNRVRQMLHLQGLGRHRPDEIYAAARADLQAVADYLEDRPFFMGERLTTIDAIAYGFLANILYLPLETELKRSLEHHPTLVAFCECMEQGLQSEV